MDQPGRSSPGPSLTNFQPAGASNIAHSQRVSAHGLPNQAAESRDKKSRSPNTQTQKATDEPPREDDHGHNRPETLPSSETPDIIIKKGPKRWVFTKPLGGGGYGDVFKGMDEQGHEVAGKRFRSITGPNSTWITNAMQEIDLLQILNHQNVVKIITYAINKHGELWMIMELCDFDCITYLKDHSPSYESRLQIILQCVEALMHIHEKKIVHRDLKPSNIVVKLGSKPCFKVCDFGLSKSLESSIQSMDSYVGTKYYLAPEVHGHKGVSICSHKGAKYDFKIDTFSLGLTCFDILLYEEGRKIGFYPEFSGFENSKGYHVGERMYLHKEDPSNAPKCEFIKESLPDRLPSAIRELVEFIADYIVQPDPKDRRPLQELKEMIWKTIQKMDLRPTLTMIGGLAARTGSFEDMTPTECYQETSSSSWNQFTELPERLSFPAVCATSRGLFVAGGWDSEKATKHCYIYEPWLKKWRSLSNMKTPRYDATAVAIGDTVTVLGGRVGRKRDNDHKILSTVDRYDFERNEWEVLKEMKQGMKRPLATAIDGNIFVLFNDCEANRSFRRGTDISVQLYQPLGDCWSFGCSLPHDFGSSRAASAVAVGKTMLVAGGVDRICASYDTITDKWSRLPSCRHIHNYGSLVVSLGKVFLTGGANRSDIYGELTDVIEEYDMDQKKWVESGKRLPRPLWYHNAMVLNLKNMDK